MEATSLDLFGTTEPRPDRRLLRAGPLTAVLETGQLRDVRWRGVEVLRGIAHLLRDSAWGTLPVTISDLNVGEAHDAFVVTYEGRVDGSAGRMSIQARIEGTAEGRLDFATSATAETDVITNRCGFVVLHPDDVAGTALRLGHADGTTEVIQFPSRISPDQPALGIRSLTHEPAPGVTAQVAFDGGVWEMEDQRNWSDASFKTYVRPLAWPFPYVIPAGATDRQRVSLRLSEHADLQTAQPGRSLEQGSARRRLVPPLYLRLDGSEPVPRSLAMPRLARGLIVRILVGRHRAEDVADAAALAAREGTTLAVEAIFPQRDPEAEAAACLAALEGHEVEALLVAAERDLRTRPSGNLPEGEAPLEATVAALQRSGFAGRIGAGVPSLFTEFNRNPPPAADFAFFGICPTVHAADDLSVMETLSVIPAIMRSAAALVPGTGLWPGPLTIAPIVNPYGPGLVQTDGASRVCLAARDPRHGALFGAAHLLAAMAAALPEAEALAPILANGPNGPAAQDGRPHPLAFLLAELAQAEGAALAAVAPAAGIGALAWTKEGRRTTLLANTSAEPVDLTWPPGLTEADILMSRSEGWAPFPSAGATLQVGPYRTLRLREHAKAE